MPETSEDKRISVRLSSQAEAAVKEIQSTLSLTTMGEAVRRAIGDELFLLRQRKDGWTVLLRKGNEYKEIIWPGLT
jgi:hypothetical protein